MLMLYLSGILFALQIVIGQSLYNTAVNRAGFELTAEFLFSTKMLSMIFSPIFIGGLAFFLAATGINFWMFTKWDFSSIQAVTVPFVLAISILIGWRFFDESVSLINIVGIAIMVGGVFLATLK